jgi:hypothetical protein
MAKIFPDSNRMSVVFASHAEESVYLAAKQLGDDWRVYYSSTLSTKEPDGHIKDGEMDFIFFHPHWGVIVMEVKGGMIRLDGSTGQFHSLSRNGREFLIKNPFQQAIVFRNRFVRFLRGQDVSVPVSHVVCFPDVNVQDFPAHATIEPATLMGRSELQQLASSLEKVASSFHKSEFLRGHSSVDAADRLDQLLIGSTFKTKPHLGDYIRLQELKVHDHEMVHESLVLPLLNSRRLGVEGEAGSGKTMLAISLAEKFPDDQVLMLVSSPLLAGYLKTKVPSRIEVVTYQELASSFQVNLLVAPPESAITGDQWIQYEAPARLKQAIELSTRRYDVLLVDEAQDVQPMWWIALESLLRHKDVSRLFVFFDRGQGVFGGGDMGHLYKPEDILPVPAHYVQLNRNYRNTAEIAQFARPFKRGLQSAATSERIGYRPSILDYANGEEAWGHLEQLVHRLVHDHHILPNDIVILSARAPESRESILHGRQEINGLKLMRITTDSIAEGKFADPQSIPVATVAAFKGLEAKIVIAVNFSEHKMPVDNPIMSSLMYVAFTRAKHMLYVLIAKDDGKHVALMRAFDQILTTGQVVLDDDDQQSEFVAKVSYYDSARFGVAEIATQDGHGTSVIIMPQDVEMAGLSELRPKDEIRIRLRMEGGLATGIPIGK